MAHKVLPGCVAAAALVSLVSAVQVPAQARESAPPAASAAQPQCGQGPASYIGTYQGTIKFSLDEDHPGVKSMSEEKRQELRDFFNKDTGKELKVRFWYGGKDMVGINDYWADTSLRSRTQPDAAWKDYRSGYQNDLTPERGRVEFTIQYAPPMVQGSGMRAIDVNPGNVRQWETGGWSMAFRRQIMLEAHECAPGSKVPQRLTRTFGTSGIHEVIDLRRQ